MDWLYYLLEANLYGSLLYLFYKLLLQRSTFFHWNRWYLLSIPVLMFLIPLVTLRTVEVPEFVTWDIPENLVGVEIFLAEQASPLPDNEITWESMVRIAYTLGLAFFLGSMLVGLFQIGRLYFGSPKTRENGITVVSLSKRMVAFSFFRCLFISEDMKKQTAVIVHEHVHIQDGHTIDVLLMELLRTTCWFNPLMHLLAKDVKLNHEFLADNTASQQNGHYEYALLLINQACQGSKNHLVNPITDNKNQLKKRINMLENKKSTGIARLKYLFVAPLLILLLTVSVFAINKDYAVLVLKMDDLIHDQEFVQVLEDTLSVTFGGLTVDNDQVLSDQGRSQVTKEDIHVVDTVKSNDTLTEKEVIVLSLKIDPQQEGMNTQDSARAKTVKGDVFKSPDTIKINVDTSSGPHMVKGDPLRISVKSTGQNLKSDTSEPTEKSDRRIRIDATTGNVKISYYADTVQTALPQFDGIYSIGEHVYSNRELRKILDKEHELVFQFSRNPVLGVYSANSSSAVKIWGEQAQEGVVFVREQ